VVPGYVVLGRAHASSGVAGRASSRKVRYGRDAGDRRYDRATFALRWLRGRVLLNVNEWLSQEILCLIHYVTGLLALSRKRTRNLPNKSFVVLALLYCLLWARQVRVSE
jgi:hypothetical protein